MELPLPAFLVARETDRASVAVARAYKALQSHSNSLMNVIIGDGDTVRSTFTDGIPGDKVVLLYDTPYSTAMRFAGKHRLPTHWLSCTPRWCVGIAHRLADPTCKRSRDHCAEQLAAVFAEERVRAAYEKLELPWGQFPLKRKCGMRKPSNTSFRSQVIPS